MPTAPAYTKSFTFTRPADTTAYAVGDVVADATSGAAPITFTALGSASNLLLLTSFGLRIDVSSVPSGMGPFRLHFYNAVPSVINDNAAFNLPTADRSLYLGPLDVTTPEDDGDTLYVEDPTVRKVIQLGGEASLATLWARLETRSAFTPTSAAVFTVSISAVQL